MRLLAALASAFRAVLLIPAFVWEGGKWILRAVSSRQPDPVLPAQGTAEEYLDAAPAPGPRLATVDGIPVRHEMGVTLVLAARHAVAGGPAMDLRGLPDDVQVWLSSLTGAELKRLAATPPHVAEAIARGEPVPGLPPLHADASAPVADVSADEADMSADQGPIYSWDEGDAPLDREMRGLMAHLQAQHVRIRRTA